MFDKETLLTVGKEKKISNKGFLEKLYYQDLLLYDLSISTVDLIFKGGTALYKFYNLTRFSEDLDFSCDNLDSIKSKVKSILKKRNITIKSENTIYKSYLLKGEFEGVLTKRNTIELDFAKSKVYHYDVKRYTSSFTEIPSFLIKVVSLDEMFLEKISALINRTKLRDIYDVYFLSRFMHFDSELWFKKFGGPIEMIDVELNINLLKPKWKKLNSYILAELPDFEVVKEFVLDKLKQFNEQLKTKK